MKTLSSDKMITAAHAVLSPSSAHRWQDCAAAPLMESNFPDDAGEYAREGTAAHDAAALALLTGQPVKAREHLSEDLVPHVQEYVDLVERMAQGKVLHIEKRLSVGAITSEENAFGTADAVIVSSKEIIVMDLKFGRGVKVEAKDNPQLFIYGMAAKVHFNGGARPLRLVIFQPRLHHMSEWTPTADEMGVWSRVLWVSGKVAMNLYNRTREPTKLDFSPSEENCRFCRARANCGALAEKVQADIGADFDALAGMDGDKDAVFEYLRNSATDIAKAYAAVPVIESWCRAVSAEVERRLHDGEDVPGFKLVAGRKGVRYWSDSTSAADALRALQFSDSDIFEQKLISPAQAEKLFKASGMDSAYWQNASALIAQNDAKPVVAPAGDKRPALSTAAKDDFAELE